jgi:mono/diheme cytochrome c family protein
MRIYLRLAAIAALTFFAAGCGHKLPPSKPLDQLTDTERSGYIIYQNKCARCHYANSTHGLHGPGLQGIYKLQYMPSGAPANDDRISATVLHGRNNMPAFGDTISDQELAQLLAYLHTL